MEKDIITIESRERRTDWKSIFTVLMAFALLLNMAMFMGADLGYCAGDAASNIQNAFNDGANQVYTVMRAVVTPICIILIGAAGFQFLFGGQRGTEKARSMLFAAGIGIAVVLLAPLFGQALATWFKDSASGDLGNFNPLVS